MGSVRQPGYPQAFNSLRGRSAKRRPRSGTSPGTNAAPGGGHQCSGRRLPISVGHSPNVEQANEGSHASERSEPASADKVAARILRGSYDTFL
jgi:hypothetical protein